MCKTDVAKQYVGWAVHNGFAVIDVNIPKYITDLEVKFRIVIGLSYTNDGGVGYPRLHPSRSD
jgi:hypothetical protein